MRFMFVGSAPMDPELLSFLQCTFSYKIVEGYGIEPDIEVALEDETSPLEPDPGSDNQLAAAIEEVERLIGEKGR